MRLRGTRVIGSEPLPRLVKAAVPALLLSLLGAQAQIGLAVAQLLHGARPCRGRDEDRQKLFVHRPFVLSLLGQGRNRNSGSFCFGRRLISRAWRGRNA